jgi:hypothetical protein
MAMRSGYIRDLPREEAGARDARHRQIARRREGPLLICHRGATAFAPENTLEAYAAAMDYGADGCEVDLRRTADGVLVLFHDDMLDRLTDGFGTVPQLSYYELLSLRPRLRYGAATPQTRPPTFAALLALARSRAMLLHLDVKEPGLEAEIARLLDRADAWDHVVGVNPANAATLRRDRRLELPAYKGPGLFDGRLDMDPAVVKEMLARPGQMLMVDDPRVAARALGRDPYQPVPVPRGLRADWEPRTAPPPPDPEALVPEVHLRSVEGSLRQRGPEALEALLRAGSLEEREEPDGSPEYQRRRAEAILERAWAAQRLGELGTPSQEVAALLEEQVWRRSLHRDWRYHGLDGAMAARALGRLRSVASVPILVAMFQRIDPALKKVVNPEFGPYPLAWTDFRTKMTILPTLGELRCPESKAFLQQYLSMDEARARELSPLLFEEGTRALLRQGLSREEVEALLRSPHPAARGTAIQECIDHPTRTRRAALRAAAPWALELPRARE